MPLPTQTDVDSILEILRRFSNHQDPKGVDGAVPYEAVAAEKIENFRAAKKPVSLLLPAFPWKSPNPQKTLSKSPDLGEELGLIRLNQLCKELAAVFPYGAHITIISDGSVYNDLLGYPDEDVFSYGQELRDMACENGLTSISFMRLIDVLGLNDGNAISKEVFLSIAPTCRRELEKGFLDPNFNIEREIKDHPDTALTYRGFVKGAYDDLRWGPNIPEAVKSNEDMYQAEARRVGEQMTRRLIVRNRTSAYERALEFRFPDSIRISIHPSTGTSKFSIPLIPQPDCFGLTPWHSCVLVTAQGDNRTTWVQHVTDAEKYEVINRNGIPYFVRETISG
ncbi:pyoverdine/dityrosine biosynthesis protein [Colletotrichum graminicola]|nr:pyoverdine/dityrosine biosynthesis protein [Colletotrichum graminicola]